MHPRNIYKSPANFKELAIAYPEFRQFVKVDLSGKARFDFKNPEALYQLTKTLLLKDFNLTVEVPKDRLIPTLPLRLNYILWIEDLVASFHRLNNKNIIGVDIGTGASCIYPLLAARKGWKMLATELDSTSAEWARKNVENNALSDQINVKVVENETVALVGVVGENIYDFCMSNPPFFAYNETPQGRTDRRTLPSNAPTGSFVELHTDGGEVEFISRIIKDSAVLREKIRIYTTMVGKRSSLKVVRRLVEANKPTSVVVTELIQGKTRRWGLAWSFTEPSLPTATPRTAKCPTRPLTHPLPSSTTASDAAARIQLLFSHLKLTFEIEESSPWTCYVSAFERSWVNQRRKRRQKLFSQVAPPHNKSLTENSSAFSANELPYHLSSDQSLAATATLTITTTSHAEKDPPKDSQLGTEDDSKTKQLTPTEEESLEENNFSPQAKKPRLVEQPLAEESSPSRQPILQFVLKVVETLGEESPHLEATWLAGDAGKEGLHQLLQYVKNNWEKEQLE